jgi:integrase
VARDEELLDLDGEALVISFLGCLLALCDDLVFPAADGDHLDDMAVRRAFYEALDGAGLQRVRFHDLRHTFGTVAASSGMTPVALQAYMGHASYQTTERYLHHSPAIEDAAKLTAAFGATVSSTAQGGIART